MAEVKRKSKIQKTALKDLAIDEILSGKEIAPKAKEVERKEMLNKVAISVELKVMEGSFDEVLKANGWKMVRADQQGRYFIVKNTGDVLADWIYRDGLLSTRIDMVIDTRKSKFMIKGKTLHVV